jgi:hypothetical protein
MSQGKFGVNFNQIKYDFYTRSYQVGTETFRNYNEARSRQWGCSSCSMSFGSLKDMKKHRAEVHAY